MKFKHFLESTSKSKFLFPIQSMFDKPKLYQ